MPASSIRAAACSGSHSGQDAGMPGEASRCETAATSSRLSTQENVTGQLCQAAPTISRRGRSHAPVALRPPVIHRFGMCARWFRHGRGPRKLGRNRLNQRWALHPPASAEYNRRGSGAGSTAGGPLLRPVRRFPLGQAQHKRRPRARILRPDALLVARRRLAQDTSSQANAQGPVAG